MYTVYVIYNKQCDKIYIGQTKNLKKRLQFHNEKVFKGYTARFEGVWVVIYSEEYKSRKEVLVREKQLKSYQGSKFIKKILYSGMAQR